MMRCTRCFNSWCCPLFVGCVRNVLLLGAAMGAEPLQSRGHPTLKGQSVAVQDEHGLLAVVDGVVGHTGSGGSSSSRTKSRGRSSTQQPLRCKWVAPPRPWCARPHSAQTCLPACRPNTHLPKKNSLMAPRLCFAISSTAALSCSVRLQMRAPAGTQRRDDDASDYVGVCGCVWVWVWVTVIIQFHASPGNTQPKQATLQGT